MKKKLLVVTTIVITTLVACTKKPVTPTNTTSTKPVAVDSCGCEQHVYHGYNLLHSTNGPSAYTKIDTLYWKFPMKDTATVCKGNYMTDTSGVYYRQIK